jgi:hypothetical protein
MTALQLLRSSITYMYEAGVPWPLALPVALGLCVAIGLTFYLMVMRRLRRSSLSSNEFLAAEGVVRAPVFAGGSLAMSGTASDLLARCAELEQFHLGERVP